MNIPILTYEGNDPFVCSSSHCSSTSVCLPKKSDCSFASPLLKKCEELFNQTLCAGDEVFFMPYVKGDKISMQLRLKDCLNYPCNFLGGFKDRTNANYFLSAELWNETTQTLHSEIISDFASNYVVGYDENGIPYQNIVIDTSLFDLNCWSIRLNYWCKNQETGERQLVEQYCSEPFREASEKECTIVLESDITDSCDGFHYGQGAENCHYGTSDFAHTNSIRLPGNVYLSQVGFTETVLENGELTSSTIRDTYTVEIQCVPEYAISLLREVLQGRTIYIDGVAYQKDNISLTRQNSRGRMWDGLVFNAYKECENENINC